RVAEPGHVEGGFAREDEGVEDDADDLLGGEERGRDRLLASARDEGGEVARRGRTETAVGREVDRTPLGVDVPVLDGAPECRRPSPSPPTPSARPERQEDQTDEDLSRLEETFHCDAPFPGPARERARATARASHGRPSAGPTGE